MHLAAARILADVGDDRHDTELREGDQLLRLREPERWGRQQDLPAADDDAKRFIVSQICHGSFTYKAIKDAEVMPVLREWITSQGQRWLDQFAPERLELPGGQHADLICVHPHPPKPAWSRRNAARWREELTVLPPPADPGTEPPRVLAGDFNATADHAYFRDLLRLGHVDAASQVGKGLVPTWAPWGAHGGPGLLTIDHVLVDPRCTVLAASVLRLPGSDHQAVYAEFRLPG